MWGMKMLTKRSPRKRLATVALGTLVLFLAAAGLAHAISEQEPNDIRSEANGPVMNGDSWTGVFGAGTRDRPESEWLKFYIAKPDTQVSFDVTRGVVLEEAASFEVTTASGDGIEGGASVRLPDGAASGNITTKLAPGKYHFWVVGITDGPDLGMTWQVDAVGDFATWSQIQDACSSANAALPALRKAVSKASRALAKAKKRKKGKSTAVKKAKAKLSKARKALASAEASSAAVCAIEE